MSDNKHAKYLLRGIEGIEPEQANRNNGIKYHQTDFYSIEHIVPQGG